MSGDNVPGSGDAYLGVPGLLLRVVGDLLNQRFDRTRGLIYLEQTLVRIAHEHPAVVAHLKTQRPDHRCRRRLSACRHVDRASRSHHR